MAEEFTEKLTEKVREYVFLYDAVQPECKNLVKKAEAWRDISEELDQNLFSLISCIHHRLHFLLQLSAKVLTEEVLPRLNWTS